MPQIAPMRLGTVLAGALILGFAAHGSPAETPDRQAAAILKQSGVQGGLVVHLGCADGRLTAALRVGDRYLVHGLDASPAQVEAARQYLRAAGVYGPVSVNRLGAAGLPYADNLVNLLVISEDAGPVSREEIRRVLAPGGVAVRLDAQRSAVDLFRKPWPSNIDQWTHWLHAADGNPVARDAVVGPPRRMQWFATPRWSRSHEKSPSLTGMVSAAGRVFYICDEGPASIGGPLPDKWRLVARDAFSGVLLWKRPLDDWGWKAWSPDQPMNLRWGNPRFIHRRLVAAGDRVYVTLGYRAPVSALDGATGKTVRVYRGTENTSEILYDRGMLILSAATTPKTAVDDAPPLRVMAIDAATGKPLWQSGPFASLYDLGERGKANVLKQGRLMIAAGQRHVFGVTPKAILALRRSDGTPAWSVPRPPAVLPADGGDKARLAAGKRFTNLGSLMYHDGRVFFAQPFVPKKKLTNSSPMTLLCLSAETGEEQWRRVCADWSYTTCLNVYAVGGRIWVYADPKDNPYDLLGLDPHSGEVQARYDASSILTTHHHHRCYRNKATEKFLLMGKEGVEFVDLETGAISPHRWIRGMCLYGVMPANGLLYVPPHACSCNPMTLLRGYWALAASEPPRGESDTAGEASQPEHRLERGGAFGHAGDPGPAPADPAADWPMYRHDPLRSGATRSTVAAPLRACWQATLGGRLTGPVVAGERVYLGRSDACEVVALDAADGSVLWRYGTGGPLDSPPTVYQGTVLAGCSDGWVYCLRAADGDLVWRFRAAPGQHYVIADDRLESAWPVHGSVLILNGRAYVTAGRTSFLDGGIRFFALDPKTGRVLGETTCSTEEEDQEAFYEGVTSDLLVSDGEALFMRHLRIDPETLELTRMGWWSYKGPQPAGLEKPYLQRRGLPVSETRYTYLRSGQGFLDDSLFGRTHFQLDGGESCHLLCFNKQRSYGFQFSTNPGHFVFFTPGERDYSILGFDRTRKGAGNRRTTWEQKLPIRVQAMVLAGANLFVGGVPNVIDPDDPLGSFEGRKGAILAAVDTETGRQLSQRKLEAPPVFDGLIAAGGSLYLTDRAGRVLCFTGPHGTPARGEFGREP